MQANKKPFCWMMSRPLAQNLIDARPQYVYWTDSIVTEKWTYDLFDIIKCQLPP